LAFRQLIGVEEESGGGDCPAGFGDGFRILRQEFHRFTDLSFAQNILFITITFHKLIHNFTGAPVI